MSEGNATTDMNTMIPYTRARVYGGVTLSILPIRVGLLSASVKAMEPFMYLMPSQGDNPETFKIDFMALVIKHTDDVIQFVSVVTEQDIKWVGTLQIDELVNILTDIIEVNLDFFIQRVFPSVSTGMVQLASAFFGKIKDLTGLLPSKG